VQRRNLLDSIIAGKRTMAPSFEKIIKSIEQLPASEQERIRRWLDARETSNGEENGCRTQAERSAKSIEWLDENQEKYSGQWVALDGDHLIVSGPTAKEIYSKAKAEGIAIPFVELVTRREPVPFNWSLAFVS
jgi:hypothetical protein